jgi:hypothetical protein
MKKTILALMILLPITFSAAALANTRAPTHLDTKKLRCTVSHLDQAKKWSETQANRYDKFKHCAVSCYLSLRCPRREVLAVGVMKEFYDAMGYGNAEIADLIADLKGIKIVKKKQAKHDSDCVQLCDQMYPMQ